MFDFALFALDWLWSPAWQRTSEQTMTEAMAGMEMRSMSAGIEMMTLTSISFESLTQTQPMFTVEEQIARAEESLVFFNNIKETLGEDDWEGMTESIEELIEGLEEE